MSAKSDKRKQDIVVFSVVRDTACAECGCEVWKGGFLRMESERPLCLACADLDHLVFLPSGDAALTRRSSKYSKLRAVVVRFSRARKRYERQGLLVEESALERAERECLDDSEARALARERAAERRETLDAQFAVTFTEEICRHYPGCPPKEAESIATRACERYSGRVGRSAAATRFEIEAIGLAVQAHVRHVHTEYDELLCKGVSQEEARAAVRTSVDQVLRSWSAQ